MTRNRGSSICGFTANQPATSAGISLSAALGGTRERIATGISLGIQASPEALVERAARALEDGYRKIKIKIKPGADVDFVRAVRAALGDEAPLMADANNAYDLEAEGERGIEPLLALDDLGLVMIHAPVSIGIEHYGFSGHQCPVTIDMDGPAFRAAFEQLDGFRLEAKQADAESRIASRAGNRELAKSLKTRAADLRRHEKKERKRIEEDARAASESKMIHEAIHLIAFNSGVQSRAHEYPFWLTEGLAMSFETDRPKAAFGPDCGHHSNRMMEFERCLAEGRSIPMGELVGISEATGETSERAETLYSQTAVLFDRLYDADRMAVSGLFGRYLEQPAGDLSPQRHVGLFTQQIGEPVVVEAKLGLRQDSNVVAQVRATPSRR